MGLTKCSYCGAKISSKARICPKCKNTRFITCEECKTNVSIHHKGDCPECGNPDLAQQIINHSTQNKANLPAKEQKPNKSEPNADVYDESTDTAIKLRLLAGLYFSMLATYWFTEGLTKYPIEKFFPISIAFFLAGVIFPRTFGLITFVAAGYFIWEWYLSLNL